MIVTKSDTATTVHRKRLQTATIAMIDLAMASEPNGFLCDVLAGGSVDVAMLCYRQLGVVASQGFVKTRIRVAKGTKGLEKCSAVPEDTLRLTSGFADNRRWIDKVKCLTMAFRRLQLILRKRGPATAQKFWFYKHIRSPARLVS
jgi:hypothetical protein